MGDIVAGAGIISNMMQSHDDRLYGYEWVLKICTYLSAITSDDKYTSDYFEKIRNVPQTQARKM